MADVHDRLAQQIDWNAPYTGARPRECFLDMSALAAFSLLSPPSPQWPHQPDDWACSEAMDDLLGLDDDLRRSEPQIRSTLTPDRERAFDASVRAWRACLPFAEGELLRVLSMHEAIEALDEDPAVEPFSTDAWLPILRLMPSFGFRAAGRLQRATGAELADRWVAWMHESGPYAGQGSHRAGQVAIAHMLEHVEITEDWQQQYDREDVAAYQSLPLED